MALTVDGEVYAWGYNGYGQVGTSVDIDSNSNILVPTKVVGYLGQGHLDNVVMVSAGGHTSVALKGNGTVWAWGRNNLGQLGINSQSSQGAPAQVLKGYSDSGDNYIQNISTISTGNDHVVVIQTINKLIKDDDGTQHVEQEQKVWGWGSNAYYQLTNGGVGGPTGGLYTNTFRMRRA